MDAHFISLPWDFAFFSGMRTRKNKKSHRHLLFNLNHPKHGIHPGEMVRDHGLSEASVSYTVD